jgi:hypothetical protein
MSYTRITSVTLDGNGYGTTTHAPTKNTRIEAITAGGLTSGQPLIQVKSVASFNAQRLSAGNYRFTGRVYPALSQRLVSLYRNGTLLAQGRCDSTGVYAIQKTLGRGSYNFFVRTSNDTYNLGTSSPSKILSIT